MFFLSPVSLEVAVLRISVLTPYFVGFSQVMVNSEVGHASGDG
jgi:hypothetical protein